MLAMMSTKWFHFSKRTFSPFITIDSMRPKKAQQVTRCASSLCNLNNGKERNICCHSIAAILKRNRIVPGRTVFDNSWHSLEWTNIRYSQRFDLNRRSENCFLAPNRRLTTDSRRVNEKDEDEGKKLDDEEPRGLFKRFHYLFKRYWHVAIPVHIVTSIFWFGTFFAISACGFDVIGALELVQLFPTYAIEKLKEMPTGAHLAVAYLLYKVISPLRYFVTIVGTHRAIVILRRMGKLETAKQMGNRVSRQFNYARPFRRHIYKRWCKFGINQHRRIKSTHDTHRVKPHRSVKKSNGHSSD